MSDRIRVQLELEPMGGQKWEGIDPVARLRQAQKALGRAYGWKVIHTRSVMPLSLALAAADGQEDDSQHTETGDRERQRP